MGADYRRCRKMDLLSVKCELSRTEPCHGMLLYLANETYTHIHRRCHCSEPLGPTALTLAETRAGFALEEAVKANGTKYGGMYRPSPTYKFIPLASCTCGDYLSGIQDLAKELGQLKNGNGGGLF